MAIIQAILTSSVSDTLVYVLIAVGVFITFRVLFFRDLTVDGSFVTGGSIAALMIAAGYSPFLATLAAFAGGLGCGFITGLLDTKLRISALLAGPEKDLSISSGARAFSLNNQEYHLREGDPMYYRSEANHSWVNPGKTKNAILVFNSPQVW